MMKSINTILLLLLITSCATNPVSQPDIERSVAADDSCNDIVSRIISNEKEEGKIATVAGHDIKALDGGLVDTSDVEPAFTKLLLKRGDLKARYEKVVESIKDFVPEADEAIKGKAKLLVDPQEAYLAKIMMIRRAKYTLDISYYIFHDDESGQALLHEVRQAIKRGVKVRIMLDSLGSMANAPFYSEVKALSVLRGGKVRNLAGELTEERAKAEIVIINPMFNIRAHVGNWYNKVRNLFVAEGEERPLATFSMNRRSHDKILMIDSFSETDSMAVIGGRNIANYYYALDPDGKTTFQDVEIMVRNLVSKDENGEPVNALDNYYNKIFYYAANKNLENFLFRINRDGVKKQFKKMRTGFEKLFSDSGLGLGKAIKEMEDNKFLDHDLDEGMVSIVNELQNFSRTKAFLAPLGPQNPKNGNSIVSRLHEVMKDAKSSIKIVSPYLWLSDDDIKLLKEWLAQDPSRTLEVISNSVSTTDNIPAQAMVDTILGPKLVTEVKDTPIANQIKVYAYGRLDDAALGGEKAYGKLHAKFVVVDEKTILVGTTNLDPRSRYLNTELGVLFEGKKAEAGTTAKELNNFFKDLVSKSYEWGSDDWKKVREHENNHVSIILQGFVGKIIHFFNLVPLI